MIKKIIFIGHKYDSGETSQEGLIYNAFHNGFKNLNFNLKSIFYEEYESNIIDKIIIDETQHFNPDMIFFVFQEDKISHETLEILKNKSCISVNFYGDDCWRFETFTLTTYHLFNYVISADDLSPKKYEKHKISNVLYSQWAGLSEYQSKKTNNQNFDYELTFIGGYNEYRDWICKELKRNDIDIECFGPGWANGKVSYEQMSNIVENSMINLSLPNSISFDIRYLFSSLRGIYRLIKYFIGKKLKNYDGIKARIFEISSMGGLVLTQYVPFIEKYFRIGKEILCYSDMESLIRQIKFLKDNQDFASEVRKKGWERAIKDHNYENRISNIIAKINELEENK